jgi:hypothetical protein
MSGSTSSDEKLRRLKVARNLFDGLIKDDDGYSTDVKLQLKKDLAECELKIKSLKSIKTENHIIENTGKIKLTFTESKLITPGKSYNKTYPIILFEYMILNKKIHWLLGFVIFSTWTCGKLLTNHPREQFVNYKPKKIIKNFDEYGLNINFKRGGDKLWFEDINEITTINCNLFEAVKNYDEAVIEFEKKNTLGAIKKLQLATSPQQHPEVKYIEAYNLLIKCVFKINYENISEKLLKKIATFLRWYVKRLKSALYVIKNVYIKKKLISFSQCDDELLVLESEFKTAKKNYWAISRKVTISQDERDFDELVTVVQDLNEVIYQVMVIEEHIVDLIYNSQEFDALRSNKYVNDVFNFYSGEINNLNPHENTGETEKFLLFDIVNDGIDFDKYYDLSLFKNYLNTKLKMAIKKMQSK